MELVSYQLDGGGQVRVEASTVEYAGVTRVSRGDEMLEEATRRLGELTDVVRPVTATVFESVRDLGPDTVEVEFGVKMTVQAGVVVASSSADANLRIKCTWTSSADDDAGGDRRTGDASPT
ncbi:MAG: CU044_2847 family protein [Actinomycetota bacterium]